MSSNEVQPAWIPYASTQVAEDVLVFSLKIMTGLFSLYMDVFSSVLHFTYCVWAMCYL